MLLAADAPEKLAGVLLNDVGPEIEPAGLGRIRSYVGKSNTWPTWMHAARAVQEGNADVYPHHSIEDWLAMAKRLYRLNSSGRIVLDYDMKIAEPFRVPGNEAGAGHVGGVRRAEARAGADRARRQVGRAGRGDGEEDARAAGPMRNW